MKKLLALALIAVASLTSGCMRHLPRTHITVSVGGVPCELSSEKQINCSNLTLTVTMTNNSICQLNITGLSSVNDPVVIDKALAGQAALETARWNGINAFVSQAAQGAVQGMK